MRALIQLILFICLSLYALLVLINASHHSYIVPESLLRKDHWLSCLRLIRNL